MGLATGEEFYFVLLTRVTGELLLAQKFCRLPELSLRWTWPRQMTCRDRFFPCALLFFLLGKLLFCCCCCLFCFAFLDICLMLLFKWISDLIFVSQPFFFFSHLIWGVPWLWGSELLLMCCTSFTSQLSKGKTTTVDRKCSTATSGDTCRKISKCPFQKGQTAVMQPEGQSEYDLKAFLKSCPKLCHFLP